MQGIAWRKKKKPQIPFIFFLAKERMLWHSCQRWMVDEAWLLVTCDAKNARSLSLSVHGADVAVLT